MSNLAKLEFAALDISDAKGLGNTILADKEASNQDKAQAMIFIRHHLHEGLKVEYLTVKDPLELWKNLKERFDHQKIVILPKAHYDWMHLRLQDFKTVSEYNSELFKISSQLKLCRENITDEDLLEKTFSTFHATNVLLQQQYREKGFKSAKESNPRLKRGRPIGSKDKNPRKRKGSIIQDGNIVEASASEESKDITNQKTPEEVQVQLADGTRAVLQAVEQLVDFGRGRWFGAEC
ncbi:uncharacterized protein LOC128296596 [Gossypium arboreum]|uniref:uncharacterized protein LOC128296596 n=1 Tax=Gossypium arboreum TaxID=29729 RepID=UPI0022F1C418|nr:uncharacterized protein LOC128296596 [Gossypium arboreum]